MPIDVEDVRPHAVGRWNELLSQIAGIQDDYITTKHGPCPKCGGNDRWRVYQDFDRTGGAICGQCGKQLADGFAVISWYCGVSFSAAVDRVAEHLGITPSRKSKPFSPSRRARPQKPKKEIRDIAGDIKPLPWSETLVAIWCHYKKPITPAAVLAAGGFVARYRNYITVLAIPMNVEDTSKPNYAIYNISGGKLSVKAGKSYESIKVKILNEAPGLLNSNVAKG
jgi:hypothetical protein